MSQFKHTLAIWNETGWKSVSVEGEQRELGDRLREFVQDLTSSPFILYLGGSGYVGDFIRSVESLFGEMGQSFCESDTAILKPYTSPGLFVVHQAGKRSEVMEQSVLRFPEMPIAA